jgi:hypothetical protein
VISEGIRGQAELQAALAATDEANIFERAVYFRKILQS